MIELILLVVGTAFIGTGIAYWPSGVVAVVIGVAAIAFAGYQLFRRSHRTEGE